MHAAKEATPFAPNLTLRVYDSTRLSGPGQLPHACPFALFCFESPFA
jgi:hypothetical protein